MTPLAPTSSSGELELETEVSTKYLGQLQIGSWDKHDLYWLSFMSGFALSRQF